MPDTSQCGVCIMQSIQLILSCFFSLNLISSFVYTSAGIHVIAVYIFLCGFTL